MREGTFKMRERGCQMRHFRAIAQDLAALPRTVGVVVGGSSLAITIFKIEQEGSHPKENRLNELLLVAIPKDCLQLLYINCHQQKFRIIYEFIICSRRRSLNKVCSCLCCSRTAPSPAWWGCSSAGRRTSTLAVRLHIYRIFRDKK